MLGIQLDDRALFLERWRKLLLDELDSVPLRLPPRGASSGASSTPRGPAAPRRTRSAIGWSRNSALLFVRRVMTSLTAPALAVDPAFDYTRLLRGEGPVWQIVTERPLHLLDPKYKTWDEAILDAVDVAIAQLTEGGKSAGRSHVGRSQQRRDPASARRAIPFFGRYLNMPGDPLPGDVYTPRASTPRTGPSERMAVSPGRESEGILHVPTGQSGHPLSPHYGDQYRAWLNGEPTPFLPGPTVTTLTLTPRQ